MRQIYSISGPFRKTSGYYHAYIMIGCELQHVAVATRKGTARIAAQEWIRCQRILRRDMRGDMRG